MAKGRAKVGYHVPDRFKEGYGVSRKGIDRAIEFGATLIVSVDSGITAIEETDYAVNKERGFIQYDELFDPGWRTVKVVYRGGYTRSSQSAAVEGNVPDNLKLACALLVNFFYKRDVQGFSESTTEEGQRIPDRIPTVVNELIKPFVQDIKGVHGETE